MFNKKRIFIFVIFLLCLFFLMTFAGGSRDEGIVTRLVEFYDGFDDSLISSTKVEVGKDAEVPEDPEHENYVFSGWYLYEDHDVKVTKFTDIREDLKVIALYADDLNNNGIADEEEDKLTVTFFDTLGNRVLKEEEVLPGLDATAPEVLTYDGYEFGGWSRGYTNITEDITVNTIYNSTVAPTINISEDNLGSMLVYENVPTFTATATDRNGNPVEVVITTNIDGNTAGSYTVTYTATDNDGNTATITRDFVVERRNLEVTIDDKTSVYGEKIEELTYEITDGEVIEEYLPGIVLTKANGTNVGRYAITGTHSNNNYNVTFINGIYTITKAIYDINVEFPSEDDLVYDGEEQDPIVIEELPETVIPEITYTDEEGNPVDKPVDAGDYDVEITFTCTDDNYNCPENIEGTITINKAPLTVVTNDATKVYDGTALRAEGTLTGLVNGEKATLNITGTQTNVGSSDNTYTITWDTAKETNYEVKETVGTLTVTQKDLTNLTEDQIKDLLGVTYNDKEVTYNGNGHEIVITGELPSDIKVSYEGNKGTNAGTYNGVATLIGNGNYTGTTTLTATLTINKAPLTVVTNDATKVYDGTALTAEGTLTGLVNGETATLNVTGTQTDVGTSDNTYTITWDTAKETNYEVKETVGTLTVTQKDLTNLTEDQIKDLLGVTYNDKEVTYNGNGHEIVITGELPSDIKVSYEGNKGTNAETYNGVATLIGNGNYTGSTTLTATLTINKANISFVADNKTSEKGENLVELTYVTKGTIYGEDNLNINISTDANKDVAGTYDILITASNPNYNISLTNAKYKVFNDENENGKDDDEEAHYTITYIDYDGTEIKKFENVLVDTITPSVEDPTREYYIFTGWNPEVAKTVTVDAIYMATYKVDSDNDGVADDEETNTLTIKYVNESKEEVAITYTHEHKNGEVYNVESPEVKGYVTETKTVTGTMGLDDVNVEVIYKIKKFTATIKTFNKETLGYIYNIPYGSSITSEQLEEYTNKLPIDITLGDGTVIEFTGTWSSNINNVTSNIEVTPIYSVKTSSATTVYELYPIHPIKDQGEGYDTSYYRVAFEDLVIKFNSSEELSNLIAEANRTDSQVNIAFGMENVFKYLTEESKATLQSLDTDEYYYDWFVLKYDRHDGWHLDGIRRSKTDAPVMDIEKDQQNIKIMADDTATDIQININNSNYYDVDTHKQWGYKYYYWKSYWDPIKNVKIQYSSNVTGKTYVKEFTYSNGEFTLVKTEVQD